MPTFRFADLSEDETEVRIELPLEAWTTDPETGDFLFTHNGEQLRLYRLMLKMWGTSSELVDGEPVICEYEFIVRYFREGELETIERMRV